MEAYIKYKRIYGRFTNELLQLQFDELVSGGWDIIYYNESPIITEKTDNTKDSDEPYFYYIGVTIVAGKRQNRIL